MEAILTSNYRTVDGQHNQPLAVFVSGVYSGEVVYLQRELDDRKVPVRLIRDDKGKLEIVPSFEVRVLYITGVSGSGKSVFASQYIEKYKRLDPKAKFILFSLKKDDIPLDKLKPHRITIDDSLVTEPIKIEDFPDGCIVLFDDIDNVQEKKQQLAIDGLIARLMEIGRSKNIKILCTSHLPNPNEKKKSRIVMNEMQSCTFFLGTGSDYQLGYLLKNYFGLDKRSIQAILDIDNSRWVTLLKHAPQLLITERGIVFLRDFTKYNIQIQPQQLSKPISTRKHQLQIEDSDDDPTSSEGYNDYEGYDEGFQREINFFKEEVPLSNTDIERLLGGQCNIVLYENMHKFKSIYEVLGKNRCAIILYQSTPAYGHWCALIETQDEEGKPMLEFFDAYGDTKKHSGKPDAKLELIPEPWRSESNQDHTYLLDLMENTYPGVISYNEFPFQKMKGKDGKPIVSCGRHAALRVALRDLTLYEYQELFSDMAEADNIVSYLTMDESQVR